MGIENIVEIRSIFERFPWDNKEDYDLLSKIRPDLNLPNDQDIHKKWGSFASFQSEIKKEKENCFLSTEKNKKNSKKEIEFDIEKDCILEQIKRVFVNKVDFSRDQYNQKRKETKDLLPSCKKISKIFGSFGEMKKKLNKKEKQEDFLLYEPKENNIKKDFEIPQTEREKVIELSKKILGNKDFTREEYRSKCRKEPELGLASCKKIERIFGSFQNFKYLMNELENETNEEEDWNPTFEELIKLKESVKEKRKQLFGSKRKSYEWELESRKNRCSWDLLY